MGVMGVAPDGDQVARGAWERAALGAVKQWHETWAVMRFDLWSEDFMQADGSRDIPEGVANIVGANLADPSFPLVNPPLGGKERVR